MGFGNCIIASDVPQNIEPLGNAAIFFKKGNVDDLLEKLIKIDTYIETVNYYRQKVKTRMKFFSWESIVMKLESIYKKLNN